MADEFTISYNAAHLRVILKIPLDFVKTEEKFPDSIFVRTQAKLEAEKKANRISEYILYKERLTGLWNHLRGPTSPKLADDQEIQVTIAQGLVAMSGITVNPSTEKNSIASLTIKAPIQETKTWKPRFFLQRIKYAMLAKGIKGRADEVQIHAIFHRLNAGETIHDELLFPVPFAERTPANKAQEFIIIEKFQKSTLAVVIFNIEPFGTKENVDKILLQLKEKAAALSTEVKLFEDFVRNEIELAYGDIYRYGLLLPVAIYAGKNLAVQVTAVQTKEPASEAAKAKPEDKVAAPAAVPKIQEAADGFVVFPTPPEIYSAKDLMEVVVEPDNMSAKIQKFKTTHYNDKENVFDETWLLYELSRYNLKIKQDYLAALTRRVLENVKRQKDINGFVVAEGVMPKPPTNPELIQAEQATSGPTETGKPKAAETNLRKKKDYVMVKQGQHVGELIHKTPGEEGRDILGNIIPIPPPAPFSIDVGGGIEQKGETSYFSTIDGMLIIKGNRIEVFKAYLHQGDVNLVSGDIEFEGPVIIEGSVDTGAKVIATGEVTISGDIRGAEVISGGVLKVKGGINTGKVGVVVCKADMKAEFIENSTIYCKGLLEVSKAIIASTVYSLKDITILENEGVVAGCTIYVWNRMQSAMLGFESGKETIVYLGTDWRHSKNLATTEKRLEKMAAELEKNKLELRELVRKNASQITDKIEAQKASLQERTARLKKLVENLTKKQEALKLKVPFNKEAIIQIPKTMYTSVKVIVKNKVLPNKTSTLYSYVLAEPFEKSHIVSIETFDTKKKAEKVAAENKDNLELEQSRDAVSKGKEASPLATKK